MKRSGELKITENRTGQYLLLAAVMGAACLLGAAVPALSGGDSSQAVVFAGLLAAVLGVFAYLVLDLPVIVVVRFIFIFSFFF